MKKTFLALLILLIAISLCGCNYQDYADAEALFAEGKYSEALPLYESIGDYEQSSERAKECKYQLAKAAFSDNEWSLAIEYLTDLNYADSEKMITDCNFILDLQRSILNRMEQNKYNTDYTTLTNTELSYLGKYIEAEFSSPAIKKFADEYIGGLQTQKKALSLKYSEHQIEWQRGITQRYHVLNELLNNYNFLSDNMDFVATYSTYDQQLAYLEALEEIDKDILSQLDDIHFSTVSAYQFGANYTNNTSHCFDLLFYFTLKDYNEVRVGETQGYFTDIQPHSQNKLTFYSPCSWNLCDFFWEIYEISD